MGTVTLYMWCTSVPLCTTWGLIPIRRQCAQGSRIVIHQRPFGGHRRMTEMLTRLRANLIASTQTHAHHTCTPAPREINCSRMAPREHTSNSRGETVRCRRANPPHYTLPHLLHNTLPHTLHNTAPTLRNTTKKPLHTPLTHMQVSGNIGTNLCAVLPADPAPEIHFAAPFIVVAWRKRTKVSVSVALGTATLSPAAVSTTHPCMPPPLHTAPPRGFSCTVVLNLIHGTRQIAV